MFTKSFLFFLADTMDTSWPSGPNEDNKGQIDLDLPELKAEILAKIYQCQQRGLTHSFKWLSEILYSLRKHGTPANPTVSVEHDMEVYFLAKSYFDLKEYDRCAFFTGTDHQFPILQIKSDFSAFQVEILMWQSIQKQMLTNLRQ